MGLFDGLFNKGNKKDDDESKRQQSNESEFNGGDDVPPEYRTIRKKFDAFILEVVSDKESSVFCLAKIGNMNCNAVKCGPKDLADLFCGLFLDHPETMDLIENVIMEVRSGRVRKLGKATHIKNSAEVEELTKKLIKDAEAKGLRVLTANNEEKEVTGDKNSIDNLLGKISNESQFDLKMQEEAELLKPVDVTKVDLDEVKKKWGFGDKK